MAAHVAEIQPANPPQQIKVNHHARYFRQLVFEITLD